MRYERPIVMDLNAQARASGQEPLGCYDGSVADIPPNEVCFVGGTATGSEQPCWAGNAPGSAAPGDCIGGTSAFYCEAGAEGGIDPGGCRVGPSVAF